MSKALGETPEQVEVITKSFYNNFKALIAKQLYKLVDDKRSALEIISSWSRRS